MSYPLISYAPTIFAVYPQVCFFASFILFTYYTTFIQVSYIHYDERCHVIQHQHRKEEAPLAHPPPRTLCHVTRSNLKLSFQRGVIQL